MTNSQDQWDCSMWTDEDTSELGAALVTGSIIGIVLGLIMIILAALPLCCGVMKAQGKIIAMVGIPVGILALLFPLFLSMGACTTFIETLCDNCKDDQDQPACDQKDIHSIDGKTIRQTLEDACGALGIFLVYTIGYGWAAVILGIVAASLSCCILCGCCKMKEETTFADGGAQTSA